MLVCLYKVEIGSLLVLTFLFLIFLLRLRTGQYTLVYDLKGLHGPSLCFSSHPWYLKSC